MKRPLIFILVCVVVGVPICICDGLVSENRNALLKLPSPQTNGSSIEKRSYSSHKKFKHKKKYFTTKPISNWEVKRDGSYSASSDSSSYGTAGIVGTAPSSLSDTYNVQPSPAGQGATFMYQIYPAAAASTINSHSSGYGQGSASSGSGWGWGGSEEEDEGSDFPIGLLGLLGLKGLKGLKGTATLLPLLLPLLPILLPLLLPILLPLLLPLLIPIMLPKLLLLPVLALAALFIPVPAGTRIGELPIRIAFAKSMEENVDFIGNGTLIGNLTTISQGNATYLRDVLKAFNGKDGCFEKVVCEMAKAGETWDLGDMLERFLEKTSTSDNPQLWKTRLKNAVKSAKSGCGNLIC